ncbi:MAG: hypothetical protein IPO83_09595 [Chitinophagaceae bacterium]|nr:hypothetical protein [Chitinophagaceae bacterium]
MKKNYRYFLLLMTFLIQGCSSGNQGKNEALAIKRTDGYAILPDAEVMMDDWSKQNVLVIHALSDPGYIHPANFTFQNAKVILSLTHPTLLTVDLVATKLAPCLAKSLPEVSEDELQYTYTLLDEAVWDDGSAVTSDDVVFTFKASKCPLTDNPQRKSVTDNLKTILQDATNPKKFTMVMKRKYLQAISMVTDFPVLSRHFFDPENNLGQMTIEQMDDPGFNADQVPAVKKWAANFNDGKYGNDLHYFYGCGAYSVKSWESGNTITLEKKSNHWTDHLKNENIYLHAFPQEIIFKTVKDENAGMLEFKSQSMDASTALTSRTLLELQRDSLFNRNYNSVFLNSYNFTYIGMNMRPDGVKHKKILDDVRVRRAIALLVPVDRLIEVIAMGRARRWTSMVSPLKPEYNATLKPIPYDVAAASKLLEEAGWTDSDGDNIRDKVIDGERIPLQLELLNFVQGNMVKEMTNIIAEGAYPAGVKIIPRPVETGVLRQMITDHDFDLELSSWAFSSMPEDFSQLWSTNAWATKGSNYTGFGNAASDALIDSISNTLNEAQRIPMVQRLQQLVYDAQPYVFLYSPDRKVVIHKRFGNVITTSELPSFIPNNLMLLSGGVAPVVADAQ